MGQFTKRTKKPTSANKEYIKTAQGGWSTCCTGSPTDSQCNVLSNCVGYACGRFNEIYNEIMGTTGMKYPSLNCNAENFIERAQQYYPDIKLSKDPKPGAIICWSKGKVGVGDDGAGHVAIVEEVVDNDTVITSESAYNGTAWYSKTRKRGSDGNWGLGSPYAFRYFMLNPVVDDNMPVPVSQNIAVNQIEVTASSSVNVRIDPSLSADIVGLASKGFYNVLDTREADGFVWYRLGHDQWLAQVDIVKYNEAYDWKLPIAVSKDITKNQVYVGEVCVHIRMNAGTEYASMGYLDHPNAYYNVIESFKGYSYTWYKLAPYTWIAGVSNIKYYPAQSTPTPTPDPQDEFDIYVVVKGDTLSKIASKFNTTVKYLAEINNITDVNAIEVGQKLKVPKQSKPTPTPEPVEDKVFGIDMSEWQDDINMDKVAAEGVKFAILRAGFTGSSDGVSKGLDASFERFYKQCKERNIKVGAYWFSRATSYEAGVAEAKYMIDNCLKGKQFEYPIAIDVEDDKYQMSAGKEAVTQAIIGFCDTLKANHYYPALYININWLKNYVNKDKLTDIPKWIAYWGTEKPTDWNPEIWQFGGETNLIRTNKVAGLVVDQDYSFVDYDKIIVEAGLNGFGENKIETPKEDEKPIENPDDNKPEEKEPEPNKPESEKPEEQDTPSIETELTDKITELNNTIISLNTEIEQKKKTLTSIKKHITSIEKLLKD